ncbi:MAG: 50S ribosomal protein L23 [Candidatus Symbiobacter sp.]|nr:50S ribosomal protein L23 [Candidatus Symbiobacter sp.]
MTKAAQNLAQDVIYDILRAPIITEKATRLAEFNQVVFEVRNNATKPEIAASIEAIFKVKVVSVNTLNIKGKTKFFKGRRGRRSDYKKAMVTLAPGQTIDMSIGI